MASDGAEPAHVVAQRKRTQRRQLKKEKKAAKAAAKAAKATNRPKRNKEKYDKNKERNIAEGRVAKRLEKKKARLKKKAEVAAKEAELAGLMYLAAQAKAAKKVGKEIPLS
mmetsp:Transcript_45206/g.92289  ORF Transcript_45206/g.92289 Transcript_45206/m.92289 type:complete len:111 (+) Transcript_45206:126-458(+)